MKNRVFIGDPFITEQNCKVANNREHLFHAIGGMREVIGTGKIVINYFCQKCLLHVSVVTDNLNSEE